MKQNYTGVNCQEDYAAKSSRNETAVRVVHAASEYMIRKLKIQDTRTKSEISDRVK